MSAVDPERAEFERILKSTGLPPDDFDLTKIPPPLRPQCPFAPITGWVSVRRGRQSRTYPVGLRHNWILSFRRHLESGVFSPAA